MGVIQKRYITSPFFKGEVGEPFAVVKFWRTSLVKAVPTSETLLSQSLGAPFEILLTFEYEEKPPRMTFLVEEHS